MKNCLYDKSQVRYELVSTHEGRPYNGSSTKVEDGFRS
jgi:hypothetical protein